MGAIVAVEGLDGAGKATLLDVLARHARAAGARVATRAFPRYGLDVHADVASAALHDGLGDGGGVAASAHAMALLFALDRRGAADELRAEAAAHDLVLVDRYTASNAAYGAARRGEDVDGPFAAWVRELETVRLGVPVPDAHVLVRVPPATAAERVRARAGADPGRGRDRYEADAALQARCAAAYDALAARGWLAPWTVTPWSDAADPAASPAATRVVREVLAACGPEFVSGPSGGDDTIAP